MRIIPSFCEKASLYNAANKAGGAKASKSNGQDSVIVDNDSMVAKIYAGEGTPVLSALDGTVKTVSFDEGLGGSLTVFSSDDIEITYYGLRDICVERGQPVVQRSILGNMQRDYICVKITKAGRPIDPFDFFGIKANLG